jgi:hypothetical protein
MKDPHMGKGKKEKKDKKKGPKLPREIAGVKVSKAVRKAGEAALKLASEPAVGEAVAAALLAAAAALREPVRPARAPHLGPEPEAGGAGRSTRSPAPLADALRSAALDVARRAAEAIEEGARTRRNAGRHSGDES